HVLLTPGEHVLRRYTDHPHLLSLPTRRSSDLNEWRTPSQMPCGSVPWSVAALPRRLRFAPYSVKLARRLDAAPNLKSFCQISELRWQWRRGHTRSHSEHGR